MKFAFVIHPLSIKDLAKKYKFTRFLPERVIEALMRIRKPEVISHIKGITSKTGATTEGFFIGCPLTPKMMIHQMPLDQVYQRIIRCTEIAAEEGAEIVGLGAFTSVVGDGGLTIARKSPIAVTTGNSYTVATAIEGAMRACHKVGMITAQSHLAVVGATGSIGKTCALSLSPFFKKTTLIGRDLERTELIANQIPKAEASTSSGSLREADLIVSVTSSDAAIILPEHLKPGAVVCDVARPRDVSVRVAKERPDVLVIEGGVVSVPGNVDFGFNFGFPPKTAYACMSETILLALEERAACFTLGKDVSLEQVEEISVLAKKHGFQLSGFRTFERALSEEKIEHVRKIRSKNFSAVSAI